jgi:hypothetical protein
MKPVSVAVRSVFAALSLVAASSSTLAGVDVGVGVTIREPGVYGRIEIGNGAPPPPVVYRQPVIIAPAPVVVHQPVIVSPPPPLYLYVPPGHARKWGKHCHKYDACGRQVYFVKEEWVQAQYAQAHPGKGPPVHAHGHGKGRGKGKHDD